VDAGLGLSEGMVPKIELLKWMRSGREQS